MSNNGGLNYMVYRSSKLDSDKPDLAQKVAVFYDLELAKGFVEYQATLADCCVIISSDGVQVQLDF